ncbi:hypothetical protein Sango_2593000 [Sesamum angolense]|uniref:Retrovirus-related Pol polyprotein from transposon TNT 1-94 n=1 Tax=Sesamum angolense TaxID=2727404 RepID=A0AAE1W5Y7_9LAMI|nr:hypothetical protein Sango_2593000 [Sesamum angolense]
MEKKNGLMLEMQVKNGLKHGEQTYLAALIKIKPHVVQEVQDEVAEVLEEFSYDVYSTRLWFAVGMVSGHQSNPGQDHWVTIKRILRYIKETSSLALCYHEVSLNLIRYSDVDGSVDRDELKSTSGYTFLLGGDAITWCK